MKLAGLRVMVLEDEPIIALAAEDLLLDLGARPLLADRLAEAEAHRQAGAFDAAILDINIHGQRSYDFARALLAEGVPFIFATGYGAGGLPALLGDVPTLTKPYGAAELREAFASLAPRAAAR